MRVAELVVAGARRRGTGDDKCAVVALAKAQCLQDIVVGLEVAQVDLLLQSVVATYLPSRGALETRGPTWEYLRQNHPISGSKGDMARRLVLVVHRCDRWDRKRSRGENLRVRVVGKG